MKQRKAWALYAFLLVLGMVSPLAVGGQTEAAKRMPEEAPRKIKTRFQPVYPELARRLNVSGVVKVAITVGPDGRVREARIIGGHPLFVEAALDAVKRWRYEPAREMTTEAIEIRFSRQP